MYYDYYGLKQPPFKITPDTSLFFPGGDRGAILDALIYAIVSGEGIVKLVGEVGSGKTTLCRMLEKELPENVEIVYLANPSLSPDNILHAIAFELGLEVKPDDSRLQVMNNLQHYLLDRHAANKQVVVFIEEAQSMPLPTLEEIRLLSNLETAQNKLLQMVIFGQPELDSMIAKPEIRQLKERITYSFYLAPLKEEEIRDYINSRVRACGYRSTELFNDKAIKIISKYSHGLLRRINILADKALLASYADNSNKVSAKHVQLAAKETEFVGKQSSLNWRWGTVAVASIVLVSAVIIIGTVKLPEISTLSPSVFNEQEKPDDVVPETPVAVTAVQPAILQKTVKTPEQETDYKAEKQVSVRPVSEKTIVRVPPMGPMKPGSSEREITVWQTLEHSVYVYPEKTEPVHREIVETEKMDRLLEINDLFMQLDHYSEEEQTLLKQLAVLPAESAISTESGTNELTCKLCSTIIYRPIKVHNNL